MKRLSDYEDERVSNWRVFSAVFYFIMLGLIGFSLAHIVRHGYMPWQDYWKPIQRVYPDSTEPGRYMLKTTYRGESTYFMGTFQQVQKRKCVDYDAIIRAMSESDMLNRKNCDHAN